MFLTMLKFTDIVSYDMIHGYIENNLQTVTEISVIFMVIRAVLWNIKTILSTSSALIFTYFQFVHPKKTTLS